MNHFPPDAIAIKIAVALGAGMLVGFEREAASKDVGIRTFGLVSLLGVLTVLISTAYAITAMVAVMMLIAFLNVRSILVSRSLEITTSAALLVTYAVGLLVGLGHTFTPVATAIIMTLLLAWKLELRRFAGGVSLEELRGAVLLGLIGLVIYPILPNRFLDRWELVNIREAWITVIVVAGIGFVNYVLLRLYSTRGLYWTAVLGGLVNSRAAVAELIQVQAGPRIVGVVMFATVAMFIRNAALLAVFAPRALYSAVTPLTVMSIVAVLFRTGKVEDEPGRELKLSSPVSLRRVLSYGMLFVAIEILGTLAHRAFGNAGFMAATALSALASSASATAAAANLAASGKIMPELAGTAAVIASMASAVTNVPLVTKRVATRDGAIRFASSTLIQVAAGIAVLAVQHFVISRR
jgi:uncharacterized membrane protein (DUF4010 family)